MALRVAKEVHLLLAQLQQQRRARKSPAQHLLLLSHLEQAVHNEQANEKAGKSAGNLNICVGLSLITLSYLKLSFLDYPT